VVALLDFGERSNSLMGAKSSKKRLSARLITVAAGNLLPCWEFTARGIVKNIGAEEYCVVVPHEHVEAFERKSPPGFLVLSEDHVLPGASQEILKRLPPSLAFRSGWYLQQLLKLEMLRTSRDFEYSIIWDADTLPLRRIRLIGNDGKILLATSGEFHEPYFDQIEPLLGMKRVVDRSFVAQYIVVARQWQQDLFEFFSRSGFPEEHFIELIFEAVDFKEFSGFSEFELIGTWITNEYPSDFEWASQPWSRFGRRMVNSPRVASWFPVNQFLGLRYSYLSFEMWDKAPAVLDFCYRAFRAFKVRAREFLRWLPAVDDRK